MDQFLRFSLRQIDAMVDLIRAPLDRQQRTLLGALLTIDVHARDVIRTLVAKKIGDLDRKKGPKDQCHAGKNRHGFDKAKGACVPRLAFQRKRLCC